MMASVARIASFECTAMQACKRGLVKKEYDFTKAKRGALAAASGKTRVTIRLDNEVLDWFRK